MNNSPVLLIVGVAAGGLLDVLAMVVHGGGRTGLAYSLAVAGILLVFAAVILHLKGRIKSAGRDGTDVPPGRP